MYYHGRLRQTGGGSKGLGDIFHAFSRVLIPGMVNLYKNRSNKDYWRTKALQQGPSILKNAVKLGVGVVSDIAKKKDFKTVFKRSRKKNDFGCFKYRHSSAEKTEDKKRSRGEELS